ncbi:hypothetical protein KY362_07240 [Candidatus Woesearchaeota archaeon]|nr:hypothetical protein [Candidatus Woesearchaeota archaeon]
MSEKIVVTHKEGVYSAYQGSDDKWSERVSFLDIERIQAYVAGAFMGYRAMGVEPEIINGNPGSTLRDDDRMEDAVFRMLLESVHDIAEKDDGNIR